MTGATRTDSKTFEVTGVLTPDATGTYEDVGEWLGKRSYQRTPNGWFIWWDGATSWMITFQRGNYGPDWWFRTSPDIEGIYTPGGTAVGDATVTEV